MRGRPLAHARNDDVYTRLGVRPVINADGSMTLWGGAALSPNVKRAMEEADGFVEMEDADAAKAIEAMDGRDFGGRSLRVNEARENEARGPRRDGPPRDDYR